LSWLRAAITTVSGSRRESSIVRWVFLPSGEVISDQALLGRLQQGDEAALGALYDRYAPLLYSLAFRVVGDRQLAQEVIQDAFLRCWDQAERYDPARGRVAAWLIGVTRHRAIDVLRSRSHRARLREREALPASGSPGESGRAGDAEDVLLREAVSTALQALPESQRHAIELAYYGGLTQSDIAAATNEPLGTVKGRIRIGLDRLRQVLGPLLGRDEPATRVSEHD
jgi:RNA polymerase sigma-70 factor (ECF subfamily)